MVQGERRYEAMSDAEFLADYEAKHGRAAMEKVARALAMDVPRRVPPPVRVGRKPKVVRGVGAHTVPVQGRGLRERLNDPEPETVRIVTARRAGDCSAKTCRHVGGRRFFAGEEVVRLFPSRRLVHGECARAAAWERCQGRHPAT